jgi:glycosyltransferase involved in cell wall biosynthesis
VKIAHYLNHTEKGNGHVAVAVDLACEQASKGHEVYMLSGAGDFDDVLERNGVTVVQLGRREGWLPRRLVGMAATVLPKLISIRPDIVHAHMVAAAVAAKVVRPLIGYKLVTSVHNSFDPQAPLMRVGDRVIAVSESVRLEMIGKGVPANKLRTVCNGTIGGARRPLVPLRHELLAHPAVVTVAGLHPRKGIHRLIEAFALVRPRHPRAQLYLVGDGPCRADYERQAQEAGLAAEIHFLGHRDDPREVLASADIFALASLSEPFGLVVAEARQMGCAVIASDIGGIPEAAGGVGNAILVPPDDPEALAAGLDRLLSDDVLREAMAKAASSNLDALTVERMGLLTQDVYEEALGR